MVTCSGYVRWVFVFLALSLVAAPVHAEVEPGDLTLTVTPERNGNSDPFSGEMVLLRIRGVYKQAILLEELVQPSLANFSWTQLGRDHWGKTKLPDGQNAVSFDRTIAVFPHHSGDFVIEPFTHRLTINDLGQRRIIDVRSASIPFPVAQWTQASGGPDVKEPWWLPAHDVTISDSWNPDPETVKIGESTRRIVTIEAQGMVAEGLPPRPVMRTRGILTFAGPVSRETLVTPAGPVARATYQWDVKPGVPEAIPLDAIVIPWFDTRTRTLHEAEIPARQIGGGLMAQESENGFIETASPFMIGAAGLTSFGFGLLIMKLGGRSPQRRLPLRARKALRRAAQTNDRVGFRTVLVMARRQFPDLVQQWKKDPVVVSELMKLDQSIYASKPVASPNLSWLARTMSQVHDGPETVRSTVLRPIDGPIQKAALS